MKGTAQPESSPGSLNLAFLEELYADYARDPSLVPEDWRRYFESLGNGERPKSPRSGPSFRSTSLFHGQTPITSATAPIFGPSDAIGLQDRVDQLLRAYRVRGHMA